MKNFLVLNVELDITRYFTVDNIPMAKAKAKQLNWSNEKTIVCSLLDGYYEPTLRVEETRLRVFDAYYELDRYLKSYLKAIAHLPTSFRYHNNLRKII